MGNVENTVSMLRGLVGRYEAHHGVRIADAALVASAELSNKYITHRFNPDKSIDLLDEAAAMKRTTLDSRPEKIDQLERRILQLEIEATALKREKDKKSKEREKELRKEIQNLKETLAPINAKWEAERSHVDELKQVREKLEVLEAKSLQAERTGDFETAADLKYGAIPDLRAHLAKLESNDADRRASRSKDQEDESIMDEVVTPEDIATVISRWTGIPVSRLSQTDRERLLKLDKRLQQRVIGQNLAIKEVTDAILRSKAGLARENQPTGSFLFLGPTGVGKTELSKALFSELYDGDERHLVRIDMSEYQEQHSVARLIGAPPGYIGHDEGGQLTEAVRKKPYTVVLLDEVEKAHPKVLTILLQVLDEGRLTDSKGRTVDFTNTVIILTSNIGSEFLIGLTENSRADQKDEAHNKVMMRVRNSFPPEFLNRLSATVVFNSLGACPVERYLESEVVTALSRMLISGELSSGTTVHIEGIGIEHEDVPVAKRSRNCRLRYRLEQDSGNESKIEVI